MMAPEPRFDLTHHVTKRRWRGRGVRIVAILSLMAASLPFEALARNAARHVEEWLLLGPVPSPAPAFSDAEAEEIAKELLSYPVLAVAELSPAAERAVPGVGLYTGNWRTVRLDTHGLDIPGVPHNVPAVAYLATYLEVDRWSKIDLSVRSNRPFELFIGGESVARQEANAAADAAPAKGTAKLARGKHLMVIKTVSVPGDSVAAWRIRATTSGDSLAEYRVSTDPRRRLSIGEVLDGPTVTGVRVSPDGKLFVATVSRREPKDGELSTWIEIRRVRDHELVREIRDMNVSALQWAPSGHRLSYVHRSEGQAVIRQIDLDNGVVETLVDGIDNLSGYRWDPEGRFVAFGLRDEPEDGEKLVKRMKGLYDKRAGDRRRTFLYVSSVPNGMKRRVTGGEYTTRLRDIHPDTGDLLVSLSREDVTARPYSRSKLVEIDLETHRASTVWEGHWFGGARWSPDGSRILMWGGPSMFGDVGRDVPEGVTANEYDTQAYLLDPQTGDVDPITREFDPRITAVHWPTKSDHIYFVAEESEFVRLFRYNMRRREFQRIELPCDVIHASHVARDEPVAVLTGSSANVQPRVLTVDLSSGRVRRVTDPAAERFGDVTLGQVTDFDFEASDGSPIVGRVHYPPDFDPGRKWPCIVYYYGGTVPVTRSFGGRYPKNLWAAMGYVVYVMQPSGATGFGQAFSARHVNDWGKTTADEVIRGTQLFLEAHDFVDPERVGCIGASYGGFMTQLLVTRTDMFAAAVSHAGISSISSYWGEGYWGYGYNSVSAANSFPWNRPDIYIDQSPLFRADRVNTPLLLLHGSVDTNVPRGESDQMYTALKLLGKEVEYIRVEGQDHHILDDEKRRVWSDTILAWFDQWLKDEPQWWKDLYPPLDDAAMGNDGSDD